MKKTYIVTVDDGKESIRKSEQPVKEIVVTEHSAKVDKQEQVEPPKLSKKVNNLIEEYIFPFMCMAYLMMLFSSVIYPQGSLSLFISLFSLGLVCFYSEIFEHYSNLYRKSKRDRDIWSWAYSAIFTIISFIIIEIMFMMFPSISFLKDYLANWFTWLSIAFFVIDRTWRHQQIFK